MLTPYGEGVSKRPYDASRRQAAALERRARIAETAAALFAERGWTGTTVAAVAEAAGVSVELVTKSFGGKPGLFMAAFRQVSFDEGVALSEAFARLELDDEPDREVRLDRIVDFACAALVPMAPLVAAMTIGAEHDPDLAALVHSAEQGHAATAAEVVRLLAEGRPRPDVVDEVYVITLAETYLAFTQQRSWSLERYRAWLRRALRASVT